MVSPGGKEMQNAPTLARSIYTGWLKKVEAGFSPIASMS
jgi:hypothetical protein